MLFAEFQWRHTMLCEMKVNVNHGSALLQCRMKLRVRINTQSRRLELDGAEPTLSELRGRVRDALLPQCGLGWVPEASAASLVVCVRFGVSDQIWINISCSDSQQPMLCSECTWCWLLASGIISWIFHMGLIWSCSVMLLTLSFLLSIWSSSHVSVSLSLCSGLMWSSVCLWTGRRFCWTRDRRSPRVGLFLVIWSLWFYLSKHKLPQKPWAEQTQPHPVRRWALTRNILMK